MSQKQLVIETLYAFLSRDEAGEGLVGWMTPTGWQPLVGADLDRVASLEPLAQDIANATNKTIELVHFTTREDIKSITPNRLDPGPRAVSLGEDVVGLPHRPPQPDRKH